MKLDNLWNEGACGIDQALYLGEISFNTTGAATGVALRNKLPKGFIVTKVVCVVETAFNAAETNVLILGNASDEDAYMGANDIAEGAAGGNVKNCWIETGSADVEVLAKYTQTGDAATAGKAEFYAYLLKLPA